MLDFDFIRENWLYIATGIGATLGITVISFLFATPIAMMTARGRRSTLLPINALSTFYVWLLDGIPLLLQIFFIFLVLPRIGIILPGFWGAVLVLTLNYGSHMSKIFYERFANNGKSQGKFWIPLIQPLTDEFTSMLKDTTLIALTGFIHDVYWRATRMGRLEFKILEAYILATLIYLILITVISFGARMLNGSLKNTQSGSEGIALL